MGLGEETILNRTTLREAVRKFEGFGEGIKPSSATVYSEGRKEDARERFKKYWEGVKSGVRTKSRRSN